MQRYPDIPRWKAPGASEAAARAIQPAAKSLREQVLRRLQECHAGQTADELAFDLRRSILSIRPRVAELHRLGLIKPTGQRRLNESGMSATVWAAVTTEAAHVA